MQCIASWSRSFTADLPNIFMREPKQKKKLEAYSKYQRLRKHKSSMWDQAVKASPALKLEGLAGLNAGKTCSYLRVLDKITLHT
jgi:hypothetical protein